MNEWEWQLLEDKQPLDALEIGGVTVRPGDRVCLHPRPGGDVLDMALAGQRAIVEAIEQDYEGKAHVCVVLEEDPGRDMGMLRQPGHRFFFDPAEIEAIPGLPAESILQKPRILVAGIGNIFQGDDAFGVEVVRNLQLHPIAQGVRVIDFGIRGLDLAYALQDGYETVILVDAFSHGQAPGTVYVVEPDIQAQTSSLAHVPDGHEMDPVRVLQLAASMGRPLPKVLLVGCEPEQLGDEEGQLGLSTVVQTAVEEAVRKIEVLVNEILQGEWPVSR